MVKRQLLKGSAIVTVGQVATYGASFARNIVIARVLTKADFGVASAFSIFITLMDITGNMAIGRQIIQAKDGDTPAFRGSGQFCQAAAALLSAIMIAVASRPAAKLFHVEHLSWAFALLAVCSLCKGAENVGVYLYDRRLMFWRTTIVGAVPQLIVTAAAWPLAAWLKDFRVFLVLMVTRTILATSLTHFLSSVSFHLCWNRRLAERMFRFGWPLLIDSIMMFLTLQGEQLIVGSFYSMAELGTYAVAVSLSVAPVFMVIQVLSSVITPALSRTQDDYGQWRKQYLSFLFYAIVLATLYSVAMVIGGGEVLKLLYGRKFADAVPLVFWFAIASGFRIVRAVPILAAMSIGDTKTNLVSNAARASGLLVGLVAALLRFPLQWIAISGVVGELIAWPVTMWRGAKRDRQFWHSPGGLALLSSRLQVENTVTPNSETL